MSSLLSRWVGVVIFLNISHEHFRGDEGGTFEESAEFLFRRGDALSAFGVGAVEFEVVDGQASPFDDSIVVFADVPELSLFEFHAER
jgi:hypothetical protein